ncbi:MAG: hypothetical protein ACKOBW_02470, partial [Planctomycetota bacterium]
MEFLNRLPRQLATSWGQASGFLRGSLLAMLAALVLLMAALLHWNSRATFEALISHQSVSPTELSVMETALAKARLNEARIADGQLLVPRAKKDLYLKALADAGALPAAFFSHTERVLSQDTPFHSQRQRDALWKLAKERELALMLRKMSGIEEVSVQYDESETATFPKRRERRATVAVRATANRALDEARLRAIRRTVMNSVGIVDPQAITVLDLNAGVAYSQEDDLASAPATAAIESDYSAVQRRMELSYSEKIRQRLSMYPGMVVSVNVELDAAGQTPRHVAASIGIPESGLRREWQRRSKVGPAATPPNPQSLQWKRFEEENRRLVEAAIAPLLPPSLLATDQQRAITIETFADAGPLNSSLALDWPLLSAWGRDHAATLLGIFSGLLTLGWLTHSLRTSSRQALVTDTAADSDRLVQETSENALTAGFHHQPEPGTQERPHAERLR